MDPCRVTGRLIGEVRDLGVFFLTTPVLSSRQAPPGPTRRPPVVDPHLLYGRHCYYAATIASFSTSDHQIRILPSQSQR
jgi:hypothetical protein